MPPDVRAICTKTDLTQPQHPPASAMQSVVATRIGSYAEVLTLDSVAKPELTSGTALVRVLSAGLAFPECAATPQPQLSQCGAPPPT